MKPPAYNLFVLFKGGLGLDELVKWYSYKYDCNPEKSREIVKKIIDWISNALKEKPAKSVSDKKVPDLPNEFSSKRHYRILDKNFSFYFGNEAVEELFHPLFQHLEYPFNTDTHNFCFFKTGNRMNLLVGDDSVGSWENNNFHLLKGRLYMELLNRIYNKTENDWLAVFHASCLSDGKSAIIFAGNSGSGKSTLAAILQKNGFRVISDDFVPVGFPNRNAFTLPTSVSVKQPLTGELKKLYPEISRKNNSKEIWLTPNSLLENKDGTSVKAVVLLTYSPETDYDLSPLSRDDAFEKLLPDTWISPKIENVKNLLDWFSEIRFFKMSYSDSNKMVGKIKDLFCNEL